MFRFTALLVLTGCLWAADPPILARWQVGTGVTAGVPAGVATPEPDAVYAGMITATGTTVARFAFAAPVAGVISVAPDSRFRLVQDQDDLVIELLAGIVEVKLDDRGGYAHLRVRGARSETTVVGTLFVVERVSDQQDFVAVIHGQVRVSFRQQVGEALAEDQRDIDLVARQGLAASASGLGQPTALRSRPGVSAASPSDGGSAIAAASLVPDGDDSWIDDPSVELPTDAGRRLRPLMDGDPEVVRRVRNTLRRDVLENRRPNLPGRLPSEPPAPPPAQ